MSTRTFLIPRTPPRAARALRPLMMQQRKRPRTKERKALTVTGMRLFTASWKASGASCPQRPRPPYSAHQSSGDTTCITLTSAFRSSRCHSSTSNKMVASLRANSLMYSRPDPPASRGEAPMTPYTKPLATSLPRPSFLQPSVSTACLKYSLKKSKELGAPRALGSDSAKNLARPLPPRTLPL